ncbi:MAG: hypothetical protein IH903_07255 [Proteobacteria bacterium]|nr:hypothetical protein [Pseudomonadota bacterium]
MLGRGGLITVMIVSLALAGCEVASFYTKAKLERGNKTAHVLLMTPDVQLGEVTAGGLVEPNAEWTAIAEKHIVAALKKQLAKRKSRLVFYRSPEANTPKARIHNQLIKLHNAVGRSILLHKFAAPGLPTKEDKFDWTLGPQARVVGHEFGADYALFVYLRDTYTSPGRVAVIVLAAVLGVGVPGGAQIGFASLVDLETGDVLWFSRLARASGDLRTPGAADESVKTLLKDFPL